MLFLQKLIKPLLTIIITILILSFFVTLLNYFNLINYKVTTIMNFIIPVLAMGLGGFIIGKRSEANGWLAGLKLGSIFIIILILFNILGLRHKFKFINFIYYLILLSSNMLGSMLGINKRIDN